MKYSAYALGATLYMPVIHPSVPAIVKGEVPAPAPSIVLCLEDALHENDVERGVRTLLDILGSVDCNKGPVVYIRPRSLDMATRLVQMKNIQNIEGFVAPKIRPDNVMDWLDLTRRAGISIMPTLESVEYFDPAQVIAVKNNILTSNSGHVTAVRLGGNDLMNALGLRRTPGVTAYDGPLAWVLPMMSSILTSSGLNVTAPVFDIIHDMETLEKEAIRDIQMGFVGKTAIHPSQVNTILNAFQPSHDDVVMANAILDKEAKAVFQIGGVMCEPSTHKNWAERVLSREHHFGTQGHANSKLVQNTQQKQA